MKICREWTWNSDTFKWVPTKRKKINQKTVFPEEGTLCYKDNKSWYS